MEALNVSSAAHGPANPAVSTSVLLCVDEQSQIGAARRSAVALGHAQGLGEDAIGRLAIVVTEAATNIIRHATRGFIVLRPLVNGAAPGVEMLALDSGPGIPDVVRAMRDGFSTVGTAGQGLGGIQRLADTFDIHSQKDMGTVVLARFADGHRRDHRSDRDECLDDRLGVVSVPVQRETECGDAWQVIASPERSAVMVVDGLGHGHGAAEVATLATAVYPSLSASQPNEALAGIDRALRGSRGAAVSLVVIDEAERTLHFSGVGNVDGRVLHNGSAAHLVPQNGIVGHAMPTLRASSVAWPAGARLVLHSDGVSAKWRADAYPGLATAHPSLLAGVLYRDFGRERDDVTVLVLDDGVRQRKS